MTAMVRAYWQAAQEIADEEEINLHTAIIYEAEDGEEGDVEIECVPFPKPNLVKVNSETGERTVYASSGNGSS